jgi:hypothetical protein
MDIINTLPLNAGQTIGQHVSDTSAVKQKS